jgi:lysozyme
MDLARLEQRIMRDEGYRPIAYQDTVHVWTLGYGSTRINGVPVKELDICTKQSARVQLRSDIYQSIIDCHKLFPNWVELGAVRQEVLVNMMYNLGFAGLKSFKSMRSAIQDKAWQRVAEEMVDSKWYSQVGGRGQRLVAAMKSNQWIKEGEARV